MLHPRIMIARPDETTRTIATDTKFTRVSRHIAIIHPERVHAFTFRTVVGLGFRVTIIVVTIIVSTSLFTTAISTRCQLISTFVEFDSIVAIRAIKITACSSTIAAVIVATAIVARDFRSRIVLACVQARRMEKTKRDTDKPYEAFSEPFG